MMKIKLSIALIVCTSTLFAFSLTRSQFDSKAPEKVYLSSVKNPAQEKAGWDRKKLTPAEKSHQEEEALANFDAVYDRLLADDSTQGAQFDSARETLLIQKDALKKRFLKIRNISPKITTSSAKTSSPIETVYPAPFLDRDGRKLECERVGGSTTSLIVDQTSATERTNQTYSGENPGGDRETRSSLTPPVQFGWTTMITWLHEDDHGGRTLEYKAAGEEEWILINEVVNEYHLGGHFDNYFFWDTSALATGEYILQIEISGYMATVSDPFTIDNTVQEDYVFGDHEIPVLELEVPIGDINGDSLVNVVDIVILVNSILGGALPDGANGDINEDGLVNVIDVVILVGIILSEPSINFVSSVANGEEPNDGTEANPFQSIQTAITQATPGDMVLVGPGVYSVEESLLIDKNITLKTDQGAEATLLYLNRKARGIKFTENVSDAILDGFTIIGGNAKAENGGGILLAGNSHITVRNCIITNCTAGKGGGIALSPSASAVVENSVLHTNIGIFAGGGILAEEGADITVNNNSVITGNRGELGGGVHMASAATGTFSSVQFESNRAERNCPCPWPVGHSAGGAFYLDNSEPVIEASQFVGNVAAYSTNFGGSSLGNGIYATLNVNSEYLNTVLTGNDFPEQIGDENLQYIFAADDLFHEQDENGDDYADETIALVYEPAVPLEYRSHTFITVSPTGSDMGDGSTESPYATIQKAIDEAALDAVITVQAGTYEESLNFGGKNITVSTIQNATIAPQEGTRGVIFNCGETNNSVLKGFTITGGNVGNKIGGGIYISNASPTIEDCIIMDNYARQGGGIAILNGSEPEIKNCAVNGNNAPTLGGGILVVDSKPTFSEELWVTGNELRKNCPCGRQVATTKGAGIYVKNSTLLYDDAEVWVEDNDATDYVEDFLSTGGFTTDSETGELMILGVTLPSYGGGVYVSGACYVKQGGVETEVIAEHFSFGDGNSATSEEEGADNFSREQ